VTRGPEASTRLTAISGIHPSAPVARALRAGGRLGSFRV